MINRNRSLKDRYLGYDSYRQTLITGLTKYNSLIREELLQYSLDLNSNHLDFVNDCIINFYLPLISDFIRKFRNK